MTSYPTFTVFCQRGSQFSKFLLNSLSLLLSEFWHHHASHLLPIKRPVWHSVLQRRLLRLCLTCRPFLLPSHGHRLASLPTLYIGGINEVLSGYVMSEKQLHDRMKTNNISMIQQHHFRCSVLSNSIQSSSKHNKGLCEFPHFQPHKLQEGRGIAASAYIT